MQRIGRAALVLLMMVGALVLLSGGWLAQRRLSRAALAAELAAADSATRKRAAWRVAERQDQSQAHQLAAILDRAGEADPDVREALVHSLGLMREPLHFATAARVAELDESGYVRQAAWLAAARLDPERLRTFVADRPPPHDSWDRIGQAVGRLTAGDAAGVSALIEVAASGPPDARQHATHLIQTRLAPLLELAGQWPLAPPSLEQGHWPAKFLLELSQRCQRIDLDALARRALRLEESARRLRRDIGRITHGRERLARLLFGRYDDPSVRPVGPPWPKADE